jgi:hypothetical protein
MCLTGAMLLALLNNPEVKAVALVPFNSNEMI